MKNIIVLIALLLPHAVFSQTLDRQVIGSSGAYAEAGNISMSYTVGEAVVATGSSGTIVLTQGFQQPDNMMVGIESVESRVSINAYPNPTAGEIILDFTVVNPSEFILQVFDVSGKLMMNPETLKVENSTKHQIDFSEFSSGNYFIVMKNQDGTLNSNIKIQKID